MQSKTESRAPRRGWRSPAATISLCRPWRFAPHYPSRTWFSSGISLAHGLLELYRLPTTQPSGGIDLEFVDEMHAAPEIPKRTSFGAEIKAWPKTSHGNAGAWKAWKAIKPAFHPSHTPWKSLRGFPHYHGYDDDYHVSEDRQSPPKTRNQSHSRRKGLVNHVSGLKRKGCPGTLNLSCFCCCCCCCFSANQGGALRGRNGPAEVGGEGLQCRPQTGRILPPDKNGIS